MVILYWGHGSCAVFLGRKFTRTKRNKVSNPFPADSDFAHSPNSKFLSLLIPIWSDANMPHIQHSLPQWLVGNYSPKFFYDPLQWTGENNAVISSNLELCSSTKLEHKAGASWSASHAQTLMGTFAKCSHPQLVARTATKRTHISSSAFAKCPCVYINNIWYL